MVLDWIHDQITNINLPTVILSFCGNWFVKDIFDWFKRSDLQTQQRKIQTYLQSHKAKIDQELEITKTHLQKEIQTQYLQTQLKTSSLYKAFPELHMAFKETEGSVYQLFYHSNRNQNDTYKIWCALTMKLAEHSLFLSDTLSEACVAAKDSLMSGIQSHSSLDARGKESLMNKIHEKVHVVTDLMKKHLLEEQ